MEKTHAEIMREEMEKIREKSYNEILAELRAEGESAEEFIKRLSDAKDREIAEKEFLHPDTLPQIEHPAATATAEDVELIKGNRKKVREIGNWNPATKKWEDSFREEDE